MNKSFRFRFLLLAAAATGFSHGATIAHFLDGETDSASNLIAGEVNVSLNYQSAQTKIERNDNYPDVDGVAGNQFWLTNRTDYTNKGNGTNGTNSGLDNAQGLVRFQISLEQDQNVSLTSLSFDYTLYNERTSNTNMNLSYSFFYRVDSSEASDWVFVSNIASVYVDAADSNGPGITSLGRQVLNLSALSIDPGARNIEFGVLFCDRVTYGNVKHMMSNVTIEGTVSRIPEPSAALMGVASLALLALRRRAGK